MSKNIPFYGKMDSLKSFKEIKDGYYEISTYSKKDEIKKYKLITSRDMMLRKYVREIDNYLFCMKDKYDEANKLLKSGVIKRNCTIMFIFSLVIGIGLPAIGYAAKSMLMYYLGFVATAFLCVPTFLYSLKELVLKDSERSIKNSIDEYNSLMIERDRVNKELDNVSSKDYSKTTSNSINPTKIEVKSDNKKLVRKKE